MATRDRRKGRKNMTADATAVVKGSVDDVVSRIERMPISTWHLKARFIVGVRNLFRRI